MYTTKFRYFTLPFPIDLPRINKSRVSNTKVQFLLWLTESRVFGTSRNHSSPEFGVELNIKHIAHCEMAQVVLDRHELPWGTIFGLARGVTHGMWMFGDMTEHRLQMLKGSNAQSAWKVAPIMKEEAPSAMETQSELISRVSNIDMYIKAGSVV